MRWMERGGLAFAAVVVLSTAMASSALALPVALFQGKPVPAGTKLVGSGTETIMESVINATKVRCKKVNSSGEGQTLGTYRDTFLECTKGGIATQPCTSVGDGTGTILVSGEYHFVYDTLSPALGAGILLLITEFHFTCKTPTGNVLLVIKGSDLGLVKPINITAKEFELIGTQSQGKPTERTYWSDSGTAQSAQLLVSVSEKEFEECGVETSASRATNITVEGKKKQEVEFMA